MSISILSPRGIEIVRAATSLAHEKHAGQMRKYVNRPYITHPMAVSRLVRRLTDDAQMIAAAMMHDLMEDCGVTKAEIAAIDPFVADLVEDLTDVSRASDGNRSVRKAIDLAHTAQADPRAKTIKACDLVHNMGSIVRYAPGFAKVYLAETAALIKVLRHASHPQAVELLVRTWDRAQSRLDAQQATPAQSEPLRMRGG